MAVKISDQLRGKIHGVLESHVERGYAVGAVALIAVGEEAELIAAGTRALGAEAPIGRDTIFRIASLTKPITAAAAMMLIEDGKLSLDEPVDRLLPELAERRVLRRVDGPLDDTVPARRPLTVADLLTFRMGLGAVLAPPGSMPIQRKITELGLVGFGPPDPRSPLDPDEWLRRLGTLPLMAQPGEDWLYTTGSNVLGVLIARAAGQSLPAFLEERIFAPLGMKDTAFHVPPAKLDRLAAAYRPQAGRLVLYDDPRDSAWREPPAFPAGDGGLVGTVDDFLALSRLCLGRGRVGARRLLSEASVAAMTRDHLTTAQREGGRIILGPGRGWGYGLAVLREAAPEGVPPGAYGWSGGFGTTWLADPGSDLTAILMTQTMFESPELPAIHRDFWRAVFAG